MRTRAADPDAFFWRYMCTFGPGLISRPEARKKSTAQARHDTKYFSAGPGLGRGRGLWAGTSTARLKQARNDPYRGTKMPIYLLKSHFIPHFHLLDKKHKARDNVSYMFFVALN
jgi:hypothetical protein